MFIKVCVYVHLPGEQRRKIIDNIDDGIIGAKKLNFPQEFVIEK